MPQADKDDPAKENIVKTTITSQHPLGIKARVLLASVFGPYAGDSEFSGRGNNLMELYHKQVTRAQGPFSLRMFHRSFGLMMIQSNLDGPCTLLDFPSQDRFIEELQTTQYDIVGISAVIANVGKVQRMCELIRQYQPKATIVIGGHVANLPDLDKRIDADHIVKGDGIRWFREYLGQDLSAPVRHPLALSGFGARILGVNAPPKPGGIAAILIPSVGCPVGCNFCITSAMFGGKGKSVVFYETGDELFSIMCMIEKELGAKSFFTLDENFLLNKSRSLRLLELMEQHDKDWALYVFSSARVIQSYTIDELVGLGISWVWMGLESQDGRYAKLSGVNTYELVHEMQRHGIRVLGSTILGLEDHRPEDFDAIIDWAVSHNTVFHQFMLYWPMPNTPLYQEMQRAGALLSEEELSLADTDGQYRFNFYHPHIPAGAETELLQRAFHHDFEINGPSLFRMMRVTLDGLRRYKNHPSARIRARFLREAVSLKDTYAAALWAMKHWYRNDARMNAKMQTLLHEIYREFGWRPRIFAPLGGLYVYAALKREAKRLEAGWNYDPPSFYEKNTAARAMDKSNAGYSTKSSPASQCVSLNFSAGSEKG